MFSPIGKLFLLTGITSVLALGQANRPFYLSTTATRAVPGSNPLYQNFAPTLTPQDLAQDTDLVSVFPEFLGIPFDVFATTSNPPASHPWTVQMNNLATAVKSTGKPIMLQTVLVRDFLVAKAVNNGGSLQVQAGWAPTCVDFNSAAYSSLGNSYINYVTWMAKTFKPSYYVVMVEVNLYYVHCGGDTASWRTLVNIERSAYLAAKLQNVFGSVFPSFKLEDLYGQTLNGYDQAQYQAMSNLRRDRLAFASYPYGVQLSPGVFANPYQLPLDYFTRIRDRNPSEPRIVISETGWIFDSIALESEGTCFSNFIYSQPAWVSAYLNLLLFSAYTGNLDAVTWWSDQDLIPSQAMTTCYPAATPPSFVACNGDVWCRAINEAELSPAPGTTPAFAELTFKAFGTMGLRTYTGTAKPQLLDTWRQFLALPRR